MPTPRRAVIVAGLRTPFAKQQTAYRNLSALDLGSLVCRELVERLDLDPGEIDRVVYGQVIPSLSAPNIAREVVLQSDLPREIEAYTVNRACTTSYQTTVDLARAIEDGDVDCGISGGAESASAIPLAVSGPLKQALTEAREASGAERLKAFSALRPADLVPEAPALTEPSTGETMGESAERMAKENGISREAQDEFAHRSHRLATAAWKDGRLDGEVMTVHVPPDYEESLPRDNLVRPDSDLERYAELDPVFDPDYGSVTAGNSSPLTDGASALLMMSEEKAESLGMPVLGRIRAHAFTALDPTGQLLLGPAYAAPIALERAGMALDDVDLIDMHEAFSAQILSVIQAFESSRFARDELDRDEPIGEIDMERFNVNGGSIAMGHPFAATGARQITQTLRELARRGDAVALCTACAGGGMGAAMILEAVR